MEKIISKLSEKCEKCRHLNNCNEKRMEVCAFIELPTPYISSAAMPSADYAHADALIKHDYHDVKIGAGITVPFDVEEAKRQLERDIYKALDIQCFEFGA